MLAGWAMGGQGGLGLQAGKDAVRVWGSFWMGVAAQLCVHRACPKACWFPDLYWLE